MASLLPQTSGPLKAWRFHPTDEDQRLPHKFTPNQPITIAELGAIGVLYWNIEVKEDESHMQKVETICKERSYKNRDVVNIHKDTFPNYDQKIKTFFEEHIHEDEEIRFILAGSGYFDVRDKHDQWIRIAASTSDMIILPAGMYHRFTLDDKNYIKAMRLFKEDPQWTPLNRELSSTDSNVFRLTYLKEVYGATVLPQITGPLQAWIFNDNGEDQRELHQFTPNKPVSIAELADQGILYWNIDVKNDESHMEKVETICKERSYKNRDVVNIHKDTFPNYDEKIKIFFEEHIHEDEEIRFILAGSGYFDVRNKDDQWIRIAAKPSDMIILPAGMYHRFTLDTNNYIKAMRLFKEDPQWTPLNRVDPVTDSNKYRLSYLKDAFGVVQGQKRTSDDLGEAGVGKKVQTEGAAASAE